MTGHIYPGTSVRPPNARGSGERRRSEGPRTIYLNPYDTTTPLSDHPVWHPDVSPLPVREPAMPGSNYNPESDRRQFEQFDRSRGDDAYDSSATWSPSQHDHGDDMPRHGEDFDAWMERTTQAPKVQRCTSCNGKGAKGPYGQHETCSNCQGSGYLNADGTAHLGVLALRRRFATLIKRAYGETKAPADVDTLRDPECPVCGESDAYQGDTCQVCGFVKPPVMFMDPNLDLAKQVDLRKQVTDDLQDPNDLNGDGIPDQMPGAGGMPDPNAMSGGMPPIDPATGEPLAPGSMNDPSTMQQPPFPGNASDPASATDELMPGAFDPNDPNALGAPMEDPTMMGQGIDPTQQGAAGATPQGLDDPDSLTDEMAQQGQAPDGQMLDPGRDAGVPGEPGDGMPDLTCPNCGFQADAATPVSATTDPSSPEDTGDGMLAGDVCPNCGQGLLVSNADMQQQTGVPVS